MESRNLTNTLISLSLLGVGFICGFLFFGKTAQNVAVHYSPFYKSDFFESAFLEAQKTEIPEFSTQIYGAIVNHHLLVPNLIARSLLTAQKSAAKNTQPQTVLLIAPNHFGAGRKNILLSAAEWRTPYGTMQPDTDVIQKLQQKGLYVDEEPFIKEHGIFNIVPFIKKLFPNAHIVPLIVKDSLKPEQSELLAQVLNTSLPQNTLVILSADFTHNATNEQAQINDKKTIQVITDLDTNSVRSIAVDTQPGVEVFLHLMKRQSATNWTLLDNTNAELVIGKYPDEGVTSYITGIFRYN